jgi:Flp pilus assembly protein TadG
VRIAHGNRPPGPENERGAALVEFALVILLLFVVCTGMVEYGLAYKAQENTLAASRSGVRITANLGNGQQADYQGLASLKADLLSSGMLSQVQLVVIYKSITTNGLPPAQCLTGTPTTQLCNVFTGAQLTALTTTTFGANGCSSNSVNATWCPTSRIDDQSTADYVGVYVRIRHPYITGFFGTGLTMYQRSVMRIEPTG